MTSLPDGVRFERRTPEFTASTIPEALRRHHRTKAGVWGRIVVLAGELRYRVLEPVVVETVLSPDVPGIVEPTVLHEVEPVGDVRFSVEFFRAGDAES